jgi:hypothetical protein
VTRQENTQRAKEIRESMANLDSDGKKEVAAAAMTAIPDEDKKDAVVAAMVAVPDEDKKEVAAAAMTAISSEDKKDVVVAAVKNTSFKEVRQGVATATVEALSFTEQEEVFAKLETANKTIREMIRWALIIIVVVTVLALAMSTVGQLSNAQKLVTIATSVLSTFAGYVFGTARMWRQKFGQLLLPQARRPRE